MKHWKYLTFGILCLLLCLDISKAQDTIDVPSEEPNLATVEPDLGASREGLRTDDEVVKREEEAIKLDGLNVAQIKELREKAEKFTFQTEVNRMMKLIINSLYRNKEIYLRELISNASDALDKIRLLSLTDASQLDATPELSIRIKADKETKTLHITDTGIGMTKQDLINNLGTIAKSGTAEFLQKMQDAQNTQELNDMIGQFGVGFYSAFLVADRVIVTTKHNDDKQLIWESDANSYSIVEDPRGNTLKRGTTITLQLKPEAADFLEVDTIQSLVKKYSQFINFPIYLWSSKTTTVEEPLEDGEATEPQDKSDDVIDEDAQVEEETKEAPKTKKVEKTIWDWEIVNTNKPIWSRKPSEIEDEEYNEFFKSLTKDKNDPIGRVHFVAEGEVTFKALLFIPKVQPSEAFTKYGQKNTNIKLYVRRVFITDEFTDLIPNYLSFIQGVVDSDDLPLNVSRETLQQHKLIKVIRKKLIRKILDMMKKLPAEDYEKIWKEYSTNLKLGIMEDPSNRTRLSKLLKFHSSNSPDTQTTLAEYVSRMKPDQEFIYYIAGLNKQEVQNSPFVERLLSKGYEVLYLTEAIDEYCISNLPEFEMKKFSNVAKEGFKLPGETSEKQMEELKKTFEPLTNWLSNVALSNYISKATVSERLTDSPCALIAPVFGWTGNMERLAISNANQKAENPELTYYLNQKKAFEINPGHPIIKELLRRVENDRADDETRNIAVMLFRTATLRSGYLLRETSEFANSVEHLIRDSLGIPTDEVPEPINFESDDKEKVESNSEDVDESEEHDEL